MGTVVKLNGQAYEATAPEAHPADPAAALLAAGIAAAGWCTAMWCAGLGLGIAAAVAGLGRPPAPCANPKAQLLVLRPWPGPGALRACRSLGRMQ